jgi:DNA-binding NarL/FixJ family response regulator
MKRITVLIVDDHTLVREGLRLLVESDSDLEVLAEAASGREAIELAEKLRPAVIVMDIAMPLLNGIEATRQILHKIPGTKVLLLSGHSGDEYLAATSMVGASGYILKQDNSEVLLRAIKEVARGKPFFCPSARKRLQDVTRKPWPTAEIETQSNRNLTSRETEVLQLVAEGSANKQIAGELGIHIKTVEKHRQRLMDKLKIRETAGLTRYAIATGVIESGNQDFGLGLGVLESPKASETTRIIPNVAAHCLV